MKQEEIQVKCTLWNFISLPEERHILLHRCGLLLHFPREFDTFPNEKQRISRMNAYIFLSNLLFLYIGFFGFLCYNGIEVKKIEGQYIKIKKR